LPITRNTINKSLIWERYSKNESLSAPVASVPYGIMLFHPQPKPNHHHPTNSRSACSTPLQTYTDRTLRPTYATGHPVPILRIQAPDDSASLTVMTPCIAHLLILHLSCFLPQDLSTYSYDDPDRDSMPTASLASKLEPKRCISARFWPNAPVSSAMAYRDKRLVVDRTPVPSQYVSDALCCMAQNMDVKWSDQHT
jgi:hypothetical protein